MEYQQHSEAIKNNLCPSCKTVGADNELGNLVSEVRISSWADVGVAET